MDLIRGRHQWRVSLLSALPLPASLQLMSEHLEMLVEAHTWHVCRFFFHTRACQFMCDSLGWCQGPWLMVAQWRRRHQRHKTKGLGVDELPDGRPVMDFTTAAPCSWNAAFSQPFFPLIRLLPDSLCHHHWRLYLSFVFYHSAVAVRFIPALPVASSQFSVPFRRLRRWMTRVIVLMKACICSLPVLRHLGCRCRSPPLLVCSRLQLSEVKRSTTASLSLMPSQNRRLLYPMFTVFSGL